MSGVQVIESSKRWWKCRNKFNEVGFVPFNILEPGTHIDNPVLHKTPKVQTHISKLSSEALYSSASSDITLSVSASRCSTDVQQPAQPVRRDLWPQARSAAQHDARITVWRHRERYKHISDWQISLISQKSQCCYCWLFKLLQIQFSNSNQIKCKY